MAEPNQAKIDEIKAAIKKAVEEVFETYSGEFEAECEEAFVRYVENEFDLVINRHQEVEDPDDPHGAGINKGP